MVKERRNSHYLAFTLGKQHILMPLNYVRNVLFLPTLQTVPDQDPAFVGLLDYHGDGIPIFNLAKLINDPDSLSIDLDTPIMLCDTASDCIGLLTSEVQGVSRINTAQIQPPSDDVMPYVVGIYEHQGICAWLLDLEKLIHHHQLELKPEASSHE